MFYFDGEIYMFWCVDDIELVVFLECGCGCRGDGDVVFLFLFYLVYGGCVVVYFINFVVDIGVV